MKRHKVDFHRAFNNGNYLNWFENKLLPNLHEPSLIIIHNASQYKVEPKGLGNPNKMRKADVIDERENLISYITKV